ncbi:hypothetical protein CGLO_18296 [Colletotrichum gloeosporioides Cg-14]|uniref:Uncharacterized protein n=1 Tax=Colletotrichum gloeosporioides (strain Cg-14) TaxID=1237896 RepID=T0JUT3_COLGC|nr:hypothetical protein CGLO_18296 [Colletotrichum gloeosporioides Cg-14]
MNNMPYDTFGEID